MASILNSGIAMWGLFGVFAWLLRDGLGPDAVQSSGLEAALKLFWTFYWGPVLILLVIAAVRRRPDVGA